MTRPQGVVPSAAGLIPFAHLGWGYTDRAEFLVQAAAYIADGLKRNHFIAYVGEQSRDELQAELAAMPAIRERLDEIQVTPIEEHYVYLPGSGGVVDAERSVANYVAAARQAIANGYTGFRAVVDAAAVARTPEQRAAMTSLEYVVDQKMAVEPFSALCAYDTRQLGSAAAELTCLHPFTREGASSFRLYAQPGTTFALTGEIDAAIDALFATTLHRTWALMQDDPVMVDAQDLQFISHRQLVALDHCARADHRTIVLRTNQRVVTRLVGLLGLTHLRVEPVTDQN